MNDPNTVINKELEYSMKWKQPFMELMNQIYWPEYAQQLLQDRPEDFYNEYYSFLRLYDQT